MDLPNTTTGSASATAVMGGEQGLAHAIEDLTVQDDTQDLAPTNQNTSTGTTGSGSPHTLPPMGSVAPPVVASTAPLHTSRTTSPITNLSPPTTGNGVGLSTTATTAQTQHFTIMGSTPPTSAVSVGSVGPTLVASLLSQRHHYDLTPVMRNTTSSGNAAGHGTKGPSFGRLPARNDRSLVSPDTDDEENPEFLHGEHLSLPADLSIADSDGPILPSLRKSTTISALPPPQRPQRAQSLTAHHLSFHELNQGAMDSACHEEMMPEPNDGRQHHEAVQFPARRFYSFTSREQYQKLASAAPAYDEDLSEEESSLEEHPPAAEHHHHPYHHLRPYQPSRPDFEELEESLPPEALQAIFIERRRRNSLRGGGGDATNNAAVGQILRETETDESSQKHHRLLENPIPMEERQWSIPSLRMAQRLTTDGGSLASLTDHLDDESLLYVSRNGDDYEEDEASITSRASSLYMSIGGSALEALQSSADVVPVPRIHLLEERQESNTLSEHTQTIWNDDNSSSINRSATASSSFEGIPSFGSYGGPESTRVVLESSTSWNQLLGRSNNNQQTSSDENSAVAVDGERALRRKRKQRQREEAALDWLHSLQQQSQQPAVAEAASSKFLTGRSGTSTTRTRAEATAEADDATTTAFAVIAETSKLKV